MGKGTWEDLKGEKRREKRSQTAILKINKKEKYNYIFKNHFKFDEEQQEGLPLHISTSELGGQA